MKRTACYMPTGTKYVHPSHQPTRWVSCSGAVRISICAVAQKIVAYFCNGRSMVIDNLLILRSIILPMSYFIQEFSLAVENKQPLSSCTKQWFPSRLADMIYPNSNYSEVSKGINAMLLLDHIVQTDRHGVSGSVFEAFFLIRLKTAGKLYRMCKASQSIQTLTKLKRYYVFS